MCQGGQGNFNMRQPGFTPGGANDPAQGGSGYYGGGSASWGGKMGRAKQMYERGGGKWSPTISNQFRAWAKGNK